MKTRKSKTKLKQHLINGIYYVNKTPQHKINFHTATAEDSRLDYLVLIEISVDQLKLMAHEAAARLKSLRKKQHKMAKYKPDFCFTNFDKSIIFSINNRKDTRGK